jgi:hypothetical protein
MGYVLFGSNRQTNRTTKSHGSGRAYTPIEKVQRLNDYLAGLERFDDAENKQ